MAWDIGIVSSLLSFSRYQPLGWIHVGFANTWAFMYVPHWYTRNTITSRILGLYMMYAWPQGCSVQKAEVGRANQACALCYPCLNVPDIGSDLAGAEWPPNGEVMSHRTSRTGLGDLTGLRGLSLVRAPRPS